MVKVKVILNKSKSIMKKIVIYKHPRYNNSTAVIVKWKYFPKHMKQPECDFIWMDQDAVDFIVDTYYKNKQEN